MCGIVGYTGFKTATDVIIDGLRRLEYRGYDSAGVGYLDDGLKIIRAEGRVQALADRLPQNKSTIAIGHTRWATHGKPIEANAHPHCDASGKIAVVHNGIIENYQALKNKLGIPFLSETDTEAAAKLIGSLYKGDLLLAVQEAIKQIKGSFAFAVVCSDHPKLIVAARRYSPLVIGVGQNEMFLASDAVPISQYTKKVIYLDDNQVAAISPELVYITENGRYVHKDPQEITWSQESVERGGFEHFMLKEIYEQPNALRRLIGNKTELEMDFKPFNRIVIVGQGTAFHSGLIGRNIIEHFARIPVSVEYGSDFRYRNPILDSNVLVIAVSQSGETADTREAICLAKKAGCKTLSIINAVGSSIARETDAVIYMHSGPEIGVASTKAFTSQIASFYLLAIHMAKSRGRITETEATALIDKLSLVPNRVDEILANADKIKEIALKYINCSNALFLGRGTGYALAVEGALKMKEISYIHAEGYDAAEMKHGPIALIDENMPVFVLALKGCRYDKIVSNIQEVKARGGIVIAIASNGDEDIKAHVDDVIYVPDDNHILNAISSAVPLQFLAYFIAAARGCDVDKPRHLAKSVTVE